MADPNGAIIPCFDVYDVPYMDDLLNLAVANENANPSLLMDQYLSPADNGQPSYHNSASLPPSDQDQYVTRGDHLALSDPNNNNDNNNLLHQNPDSWILCGSTSDGAGSSQAGLIIDQELIINNNQQAQQENVELPAQNNFTGHDQNTMPLQTWPVQFNCSSCQVLREIVHVNVAQNNQLKLEIHGRLGLICHCVLERTNAYLNYNTSGDRQFEMLDFHRKSTEDVKEYLIQYCLLRKQEGYVILMNDPLSMFYDALSIGMAWRDFLLNDDYFVDEQNPLLNTTVINSVGENQMEQHPEQQGQFQQQQGQVQQQQGEEANPPAPRNEIQRNRRRVSLAEQRQRTVKMSLSDLQRVLHLPMDEAARSLNVCPTVVKKICRKNNLVRWPFRKIKSIQGKIEKLRPCLDSSDEETKHRAQAEINRLREEATTACGGINIL